MFELNTRYVVTMDHGLISDAGITAIRDLIIQQDVLAGEWQRLNPDPANKYLPSLPDNWDWHWLVTTGDIVGKFSKRVRKYYYTHHGLKSPDAFITEIGNLARQHTVNQLTYYVEFTARFNWQAGDFGDRGSCYWGGYAGARTMLEDNGGMAVLFFSQDEHGYGRAWFVDMDGHYLLFNGYGFSANSTHTIASVVAAFLGMTYKKIRLENRGTDSGVLYINGGIGYVVGPIEIIETIENVDLWWYLVNACVSCGEGVIEDDVHWGPDDQGYCMQCFYDQFDVCAYCGGAHYNDDLYRVEDDYLCEWCAEQRSRDCATCSQSFYSRNMIVVRNKPYCETCVVNVKIK